MFKQLNKVHIMHQHFPTHFDIYSIYMTYPFKSLRKNKLAFIPKLLESILETYPDLKRHVAEKSLDSEYLQEWLTKVINKMTKMKKRPPSSCLKRFFQTSSVTSISLCGPVDGAKVDPIAATTSKDSDESILKEQPSFSNESISSTSTCDSVVSGLKVEQNAATIFQQSEPRLKEKPSCNGSNARTFCVANIWAGYPTFGSIYSTSKLDIIQQLKDDNEAFVPVMLEILIKKYPRLKILLEDSSLSDDCITETFLYILRQTEKIDQSFTKKEKRKFFNTVFNLEILSDISEQCIRSEKTNDTLNIEKYIENGSGIGNDSAVLGIGNDSAVSGIENSSAVSDVENGSAVLGIENGSAVPDIENGSAVLSIENGSAVSEIENGSAVSEIENGSAVSEIENLSAVSGVENDSTVWDIDTSMKEVPARCTIQGSSSMCDNEKSIDQFPFVPVSKPVTPDITSEDEVGNKTNLCEYLKNLKRKYAWALDELAEKNNLEMSLENKLKSLLTKQKKYKYKIKRCRKEMSEFDSFKSICRN